MSEQEVLPPEPSIKVQYTRGILLEVIDDFLRENREEIMRRAQALAETLAARAKRVEEK